MPSFTRAQIPHLIVVPLAVVGVMAAVLVWEIEHVGSVVLACTIAAGGLTIGIIVVRQLRADLDRLADHYEALLRTADEQSQRAESANRAKDEFLATLSHELRTPLNSILGWSRLLAGGRLDPEQTARAIGSIERAGWTQSRLIEDLLDLSRIISGKLEIVVHPMLLQTVVEDCVTALQPAAAAKQLSLTMSLDKTMTAMWLDADRIRQVVWNLASNAIKFTPPGGAVDIALTARGEVASLCVRDTGIGFNPEVAAHLFERFRQGDSSSTRAYGGLGLGLGIVRHIVELHGGTVSASSAGEHRGATFEVRIPIRRATMTKAAAPIATSTPSLAGVSVLVVDDDRQALDFARAVLEQCGAKVITAVSTEEARQVFARTRPDVVISDVLMPGDDGVELIREIRRQDDPERRRTPAAALTALARTEDRRRTLDAGFHAHLTKPIDPRELAITIERLARQRQNHEARPS